MKTAATIALALIRLAGVVAIVLGALFWTGNALALVPIHMAIGVVVVLTLWTLAALGARAGVHLGLVALAFIWGFVVPILGMTQNSLLVGDMHWVIRALRLLVGMIAIGLGEQLAARIKEGEKMALQA